MSAIACLTVLVSIVSCFLSSCTGSGDITTAKLVIKDCILSQVGEMEAMLIKRYCAGNRRWDLIYEKYNVIAVRKEKADETVFSEIYETSANGFYMRLHPDNGFIQTRVLISFDEPYGFGEAEMVTVTDSSDKTIDLKILPAKKDTTTYSSYLIIRGKYCIIEIFEESPLVERVYTITALKELTAELETVLAHAKELAETGVVRVPELYPSQQDKPFFIVTDSPDKGTYMISAGVRVSKEGILYIRVVNTEDGNEFAGPEFKKQTTRIAGFDPDNNFVFPYSSQITIMGNESASTKSFKARFELMFQGRDRSLSKIEELTRMINLLEQQE
ncbi:MAG: hypothetical protein EHM28_01605 [Spirochaetaceae bacterium]|nr:MAG: hypothetical protein EHM28_01605 [Spirochaetaceae bacterium]